LHFSFSHPLEEDDAFLNELATRNYFPRATLFIPTWPLTAANLEEHHAMSWFIGSVAWDSRVDYEDDLFSNSSHFRNQYTAHFNSTPSILAASASAAAYTLQLAMEEAQSLNHSDIAEVVLVFDDILFFFPPFHSDDSHNRQ
jgi:hypothetical protein